MRFLCMIFVAGCGFSEVHTGGDLAGGGAMDLAGADLAGADLAGPRGGDLSASGGGARVFTTRATSGGNLSGGVLGGDLTCTTAAANAGLGGTWRAWLSDSSTNAIDRVVGTGPWYRVDGPMLFADHAALAVWPKLALSVDERGMPLDNLSDSVWTGTAVGGTGWVDQALGGGNCDDWTSGATGGDAHYGRTGDLTQTDDGWTSVQTSSCANIAHLYCFESG